MKVLVLGAGGLVGSHLEPELRRAGHAVARGVRRAPTSGDEVRWSPATGEIDPPRAFDAVVSLAGRSLAEGRWTPAFKREAWTSRVDATRALCVRLAGMPAPPRAFVCASAIGIYGDRGDEWLDETSPPGRGFLPELGQAWEGACAPLREAGSRVASLRLGIVLAREGGALPRLLLPARLGLGGPLGSGRQFWSWVSISDVVRAFLHALEAPELSGPVNVVAPEPVRQATFARVLGKVLRRPAFLPAPTPMLRWVLGEKLEAVAVASARVAPRALARNDFRFRYPELEGTLRGLLGRSFDGAPGGA